MKRSLESLKFKLEDLPGSKRLATDLVKSSGTKHQKSGKTPAQKPTPSQKRSQEKQSAPCSQTDSLPSVPFVAPAPAKYRERYTSICESCFSQSILCTHYPEQPLKLLLIGHNPSDHAWASGFFYSNPTNKMWKLLTGQSIGKGVTDFRGILPSSCTISEQNNLPHKYGVGLTDVGLEPGNNAAVYGKRQMLEWTQGLFARLDAHQRRAGGAPSIVAFTGKRQFTMMFSSAPKTELGEQAPGNMPKDWPFPCSTKVFVLPSSSGRAVMTNELRVTPYLQLAQAFHAL